MTIDEIRTDLLEFIKKERTIDETSKHFEISNNRIIIAHTYTIVNKFMQKIKFLNKFIAN